MNNELNILISTNEKSLFHAAAVVYSVLKSNITFEKINVYVFFIQLGEDSIAELKNLEGISKLSINFVKIDREQFKNIKLNNYPVEAILRLKAGQKLPNLDRVLYLDTDTYVRADLRDLYFMNLDDCHAAVISDGLPDYRQNAKNYRSSIGMKDIDHYFNSGVMLINLKKYRNDHIFEKCVVWFQHFENFASFADQDALNSVLEGRVVYISPRWNLQMTMINAIFYKGKLAMAYRSELNNAKIIHYAGDKKPWTHQGYLPFLLEYLNVYNECMNTIGAPTRLHRNIFYYFLEYGNHLIKLVRARVRSIFRTEFSLDKFHLEI